MVSGEVDHTVFMALALEQAEEALGRGEFPVGCILVHDNEVVGHGRRESSTGNELDHAEVMALRAFMADEDHPPPCEVTVYSTMEPCLMCFSTLVLNGFRKVVYGYEDVMGGGTNLPLSRLNPLYREIRMQIDGGVLRRESAALFKRFFEDPQNNYWHDSLLARHTLELNIEEM
ncbi:MAG: nucleoside deaminase [Thermodesulfobacteriota bacterium]